MSVTAQQVQEALELHSIRLRELLRTVDHDDVELMDEAFFYTTFADQVQFIQKPVELPGVGAATFVAYERSGDRRTLVFSLGEQLFKINGYYCSYDGDEWEDEVTEVVAHEKTVTVYEPKEL